MLVIIKRIIATFAVLSAVLLLAIIVCLSVLDYISDFAAFAMGVALGGVFAFSLSATVLIGLYEYLKDKGQTYEK